MSKILARWIEPAVAGRGVTQNGSTYALELHVDTTSGLTFTGSSASDSLQVNVDGSTISFTGGGAVQIPANGVTATQLATNSVTTGKIADANVTGTKIASATITGSNVASATITGSNLASGTVTGSNIGSATITGSNIAATTITASNIANATITPTQIDQTQAFTLSNVSNVIKAATPTSANDVAIKSYVDGIAFGVDWKQAVRLTTASALPSNTYDNGSSGVGATLTATANAALSVDSVTVSVNDRILVKNEVDPTTNGIYVVTATGDGSNPYILTRSADANTPAEVAAGSSVFTQEGSTNADMGFVQITPNPLTIGTSNLVFTEFTGLGQITTGAGLNKTGNQLFVDISSNKGLTFSGGSTGTLEVKIDNSTIDFTGGALEVKTNGITSTQLLKSDTYDFATAGGTVRVSTQTFGDSSTKAASTAFVQAAVAGAGIFNVQYITLSGTDISNKYVDLAHAPQTANLTVVDVVGGGSQVYTTDFTVIAGGSGNNRLNWNTLGLDGTVISGSILRVLYYY